MDGTARLAKMLKERENVPYMGPQLGVVISPPPNIAITLGDQIVLTKDNLIIAAHVLQNYERELEISEGLGVTRLVDPPPPEPPITSQTRGIRDMTINGTMKYTDTLKKGDEVILVPSTDGQIYFLIDKAVRL